MPERITAAGLTAINKQRLVMLARERAEALAIANRDELSHLAPPDLVFSLAAEIAQEARLTSRVLSAWMCIPEASRDEFEREYTHHVTFNLRRMLTNADAEFNFEQLRSNR